MEFIRLGCTNFMVSRAAIYVAQLNPFFSDATTSLFHEAYENGINFFDISVNAEKAYLFTAPLDDIRKDIFLSSEFLSSDGATLQKDVTDVLTRLQIEYLDICFLTTKTGDLHNSQVYDAAVALKNAGKIREIGIKTSDLEVAKNSLDTELYSVLQYPLQLLSSEAELELVDICVKKDVGFIASFPLAGDPVLNLPLTLGFLRSFEHLIPLWFPKNADDLRQLLYFEEHPPILDSQFFIDVEKARAQFLTS